MYHSFLIHSSADGHLSRLLPCPGYCKQCCDEHWGTRVSFNSSFLSVYAQQWGCWIIRQNILFFFFFKFYFIFKLYITVLDLPNIKMNPPWGGRREEGSGWGTHVYLWQNILLKKILLLVLDNFDLSFWKFSWLIIKSLML